MINFFSVNNVLKENDDMKKPIKNPKVFNSGNKYASYIKTY